MKVVKISKDDWGKLSKEAHLITFGEDKKPDAERIDFTLAVESFGGVPMAYATCKELDSESLYWQYGGSFPDTKGTVHSFRAMKELLKWVKTAGYVRLGFYVENDNAPMLKLALKTGFKIMGVRYFRDSILLEHRLEF